MEVFVFTAICLGAFWGAKKLPNLIGRRLGGGIIPWLTFSLFFGISLAGFTGTVLYSSESPLIDVVLVLITFAAIIGTTVSARNVGRLS